MRKSSCAILFAAVIALLVPPMLGTASAQNIFEKLVMPGELIKGHAKLEKECKNCHQSFTKASQSKFCLDCHKDIASDISRKAGAHGRRPDVAAQECSHCHDDHKGRDADIIGLDPQTFNHTLTDFQLTGAHTAVACQSCHAPLKKHREAPNECIGCHKKDEPHKGRLGERCQSCHDVTHWLPGKPFDHSKTQFPLTDSHKAVACAACHTDQQWKNIGKGCADCHRIEDAHAGRFGAKCESCHKPDKWKVISFDHDKATKFPLRGGHRKVRCETCHTGALYKDKLATACVSCHKQDDVHKGQLGSRCETCHNETNWRQKVSFDHDLSRFPLIGLHATVACEACHTTQSFKGAPRTCNACHQDAFHEGRLGPACDRCHNPNGWPLHRFDHSKDTSFPLTGRHTGASCHACHETRNAESAELPADCYSCHEVDDKHRGAFGRACETCHSTAGFGVALRRF